MSNQVLIITHGSDGDGWASAAIAAKYFTEERKYEKTPIYFWDYGQPTDEIDRAIEVTDPEIICMTDVTLPDAFMLKHAKRIMHIDHHASRMGDAPYKAQLKSNWSAVSNPLILDWNNAPAKQCAACELVWHYFYGTTIPWIIRIIGRRDVWDKDKDECCDALNAYLQQEASKTPMAAVTSIAKVLNGMEDLGTYLEKGRAILQYQKDDNVKKCQSMAFSAILNGTRFYCMNGTGGSDVFASLTEDDISACTLLFSYQPSKDAWKVSCYTNKIGSVNVLSAIEFLKDGAGDTIVSLGGHANACGYVTTDIKKDLLDHLRML